MKYKVGDSFIVTSNRENGVHTVCSIIGSWIKFTNHPNGFQYDEGMIDNYLEINVWQWATGFLVEQDIKKWLAL